MGSVAQSRSGLVQSEPPRAADRRTFFRLEGAEGIALVVLPYHWYGVGESNEDTVSAVMARSPRRTMSTSVSLTWSTTYWCVSGFA
jgi:hypothetical protein